MGVTNKTASAMRSGNYEPGRDTLSDEEFTELRTDIDGSVKTLIAALEIEDDEVYRVGTGADRGPENTSGRLLIVLKDGSGNQPSDNANVELVELTSQNNVERVIVSATYGQVSEGVSSRPDRAYGLKRRTVAPLPTTSRVQTSRLTRYAASGKRPYQVLSFSISKRWARSQYRQARQKN